MNASMTSSVTNNRGRMYNCVTNTGMNRSYPMSQSSWVAKFNTIGQASPLCQSHSMTKYSPMC